MVLVTILKIFLEILNFIPAIVFVYLVFIFVKHIMKKRQMKNGKTKASQREIHGVRVGQ